MLTTWGAAGSFTNSSLEVAASISLAAVSATVSVVSTLLVQLYSCLSHRCSDVADTFLSVSHGHLNVGRGCPDASLGCLEVRHSCLNVCRGSLNTGRSCFSVCHGFLSVGRFLNVGGVFVDVSLGCPDISRRWRQRERGGGGGGGGGGERGAGGGGGGRVQDRSRVLRKVGLDYADFF